MQRTTLDGLKVIITRPEGQGTQTATAVSAAGGIPVLLPMIRILPPDDPDLCDDAVRRLPEFQGLVFASANAVHAFFGRALARGTQPAMWYSLPAFAVGPKTAEALKAYGVVVAGVSSVATGAALGAMLGSMNVAGQRFLLPRGDRGREEIADALTAAGAAVVPLIVYRTAGPDAATVTAMHAEMRAAGRKALFFASPSAVEEFSRICTADERARLGLACVVVAIGETTAAAAQRCAIPVHGIAGKPTDAGMTEALMACLQCEPGRQNTFSS